MGVFLIWGSCHVMYRDMLIQGGILFLLHILVQAKDPQALLISHCLCLRFWEIPQSSSGVNVQLPLGFHRTPSSLCQTMFSPAVELRLCMALILLACSLDAGRAILSRGLTLLLKLR